MATLALTNLTDFSGNDLAPESAASGGDQFLNNGSTALYIKNGSGSERTVTIATQGSILGSLGIDDISLVLADGDEVLSPLLPPMYFNDANGFVQVTYSSEAGVTVSPIKFK